MVWLPLALPWVAAKALAEVPARGVAALRGAGVGEYVGGAVTL